MALMLNRIGYIKITHDLINENLDCAAAAFRGCLVLNIEFRINKYMIASTVLPELKTGEDIPVYDVGVTSENGKIVKVIFTGIIQGQEYLSWEDNG